MNILTSKKSIGILVFSMIATNSVTYYYTTKKNKSATDAAALNESSSASC